jgi:hypothetical protein
MKALAILVIVAGATACGASEPAPATPTGATSNPNSDGTGAANAQGSDNPNRPLTRDECQELGQYISDVCHENHSRQARIEGWCTDVVTRQSSGTWGDECTKTVKYMDSVCFRSASNPSAMMVCDRTVDR